MKNLIPLSILSITAHACAQSIDAYLEPAPVANTQDMVFDANRLAEPQAEAAITVDPQNRAQVASLYFSTYLPEDGVTNGWAGSIASCNAGATAMAFQAATIERINVYRALAGLPGNVIAYTGTTNQSGDQHAALMMVANSALSHSPPTTWTCYTAAGASAAGSSNLTLGFGFNYDGPTAIDGYMDDDGDRKGGPAPPPRARVPPGGARPTGRCLSDRRTRNPLVDRLVPHPRLGDAAI